MNQKMIVPAEIKICATCSYWDGDRTVDPNLGVVVIADDTEGECLPQAKRCRALHDGMHWEKDCLWEHLAPDGTEEFKNVE